ncbi:MAG: SDR family oxidoreductase [Anaerolineae bacterium]|nr:SDR family oxidoreductase [Anaerolineae bacterium]
MKVVVITGSTRGIGYGMADAFLARGCGVAISGRTPTAVEAAVTALSARHEGSQIFGQACDVRELDQVQALWDAAVGHFGHVDIWINNAGVAHSQIDFWDLAPEEIRSVVETNVIGAMHGARVALRGMLDQGYGSLYNVEGLGSDGRKVEGLSLYGTTKHSLTYLTDALVEETKGTGIIVGALRPGMVATRLLTGQYEDRPEEWERARKIFDLLADRVETVAPWMVDKVLSNTKSGARFKWLTPWRLAGRFLMAPFRKRDVFEKG